MVNKMKCNCYIKKEHCSCNKDNASMDAENNDKNADTRLVFNHFAIPLIIFITFCSNSIILIIWSADRPNEKLV